MKVSGKVAFFSKNLGIRVKERHESVEGCPKFSNVNMSLSFNQLNMSQMDGFSNTSNWVNMIIDCIFSFTMVYGIVPGWMVSITALHVHIKAGLC